MTTQHMTEGSHEVKLKPWNVAELSATEPGEGGESNVIVSAFTGRLKVANSTKMKIEPTTPRTLITLSLTTEGFVKAASDYWRPGFES
jgi:hypothetical protein